MCARDDGAARGLQALFDVLDVDLSGVITFTEAHAGFIKLRASMDADDWNQVPPPP